MRDVVIVAGCRTPIGTIGGQFKTLAPVELTIPVMQNLIKRAGIDPVIIDDVIWGCNYQRTYKEHNLAVGGVVRCAGTFQFCTGGGNLRCDKSGVTWKL